jgi:hypothetical protein
MLRATSISDRFGAESQELCARVELTVFVYLRTRLILTTVLVMLGLLTTACGGSTGKHAGASGGASSAVCRPSGVPDACLRFLELSSGCAVSA